jgi:hypothetical protein
MYKSKLTALFLFVVGLSTLVSSCKDQSIFANEMVFQNTGIPMNGQQVVPAVSTSATGTLDVVYRKDLKTLSYTVKWTGLSGAPAASTWTVGIANVSYPPIGVYGLADPGFIAYPYPPQQPSGLSNFPNGVAQAITAGFPAATSGSYSGSLLVDDVAIKETDLLNGKYYLQIVTTANKRGEIRGQIYFLQ